MLRAHSRAMVPRFEAWRRIFAIGLPTAGEFLMMFILFGVIYWVIRGFGAHAQAGFGIGMRIMQAIFLPAMAIAFAAAPIAGQNYGAGRADRVRETFRLAAMVISVVMLTLTLLCIWRPEVLMGLFTSEPEVIAIGSGYLHISAWNFVASGLIFTCSSLFQGLGNTTPSLIASVCRLLTFALPAVWLSSQAGVHIEDFWRLSVASVTLQAAMALMFLRGEMKRKLPALIADPTAETLV
jgi:MATE family, multidrug efflux pump